MKERVYIYDRDGALVNDPNRSADYATGLEWETNWPKGYGMASFRVARDIAKRWAVKNAYEMVVRSGPTRVVYQGRLNSLNRALRQGGEEIQVSALGWYVVLVERKMRKRWIDAAPMSRTTWPTTASPQDTFVVTKREDFCKVGLQFFNSTRTAGEKYRERYTMPDSTTARRVTFDYWIRTGEGGEIVTYNVDEDAADGTATNAGPPYNDTSGSADVTISPNANVIEFRFQCITTDDYDDNDVLLINNVVVYGEFESGHSHDGSETYHADEIVEDVLLKIGGDLSSDYDELTDPGYVLSPFITQGDDYESGDSIIQRAALFGDSSLNSYGACVWDDVGTSDGKPKLLFEQRPDTDDWEYEMRLGELAEFQDDLSDDELYNYVIVRYLDENGRSTFLTPEDDGSLTDAASIASYGQRDYVLDIDHADATIAAYAGARFLAYHKDPLHKARFSLRGRIRGKNGMWWDASTVRAGKRVKIVDYAAAGAVGAGTVFVIRHTAYDAETAMLALSPDLPEDSLEVFFAQREAGVL